MWLAASRSDSRGPSEELQDAGASDCATLLSAKPNGAATTVLLHWCPAPRVTHRPRGGGRGLAGVGFLVKVGHLLVEEIDKKKMMGMWERRIVWGVVGMVAGQSWLA